MEITCRDMTPKHFMDQSTPELLSSRNLNVFLSHQKRESFRTILYYLFLCVGTHPKKQDQESMNYFGEQHSIFLGKICESYSLEVATTAHVTPFFLAVLGVTTALPFIYLTPRCHGFLKTLTQ